MRENNTGGCCFKLSIRPGRESPINPATGGLEYLIPVSMTSGTKRKLEPDLSSESEELSSHDEDAIFEVERILAEDTYEGQTLYLVKWINYVGSILSESHSSCL